MTTDPRPALAFDIGGTFIKSGLVLPDGNLRTLHREATPAHLPPEAMARHIVDLANRIVRNNGLTLDECRGTGISIAAFITAEGYVTATAHLSQAWVGFNLRSRLEEELGTNLYFALDTPAPTLGEAYFGAGRGYKDFVYVTVSTGIGAGIMANGSYYTGGLGWAGGVGHTIIDENSSRVCAGCGNRGCLETFAATQGIKATAQELLPAYPDSPIHQLAGPESRDLTPRLLYETAIEGDRLAQEVFHRAGHALGIGLMNLVDILAPTRIVIGGGIAQAGNFLLKPARKVIETRAFPPDLRHVDIVEAELGDLSGLYGAAVMVFHNLRINLPRTIST